MTTAEDLPAVFRTARNASPFHRIFFRKLWSRCEPPTQTEREKRLANALLDVAAWLDCRETVADWRKAAEIRALVARA